MTLNTYLTDRYTVIGNQLGFVAGDYTIIVTDTLELLGITLEADVTAQCLHAVAKVLFWKKALDYVTLQNSFSADGSSYSTSDLVGMVMKNLSVAESEAFAYMPNYEIQVGNLIQADPYVYDLDRDEDLNF